MPSVAHSDAHPDVLLDARALRNDAQLSKITMSFNITEQPLQTACAYETGICDLLQPIYNEQYRCKIQCFFL
jgi:hypothetical protein